MTAKSIMTTYNAGFAAGPSYPVFSNQNPITSVEAIRLLGVCMAYYE